MNLIEAHITFTLLLLTPVADNSKNILDDQDALNKIMPKRHVKNNTEIILKNVLISVNKNESLEGMSSNKFNSISKINHEFDKNVTYENKIKHYTFESKIRNLASKSLSLECLSCFGKLHLDKNNKCYQGLTSNTEKCAPDQQCYAELHPRFIKRGCSSRNRLNRTFICKCSLCNDKPSNDYSYYEYADIRDWKYDNRRLQNPIIGMDLLCKVCETKGTNLAFDKNCRLGKFADYMVCRRNQVCYINIDDETSFVSRGCIDLPMYNFYYKFCNTTLCNLWSFDKIYKSKNEKRSPYFPPIVLTSYGIKIYSVLKDILLFNWSFMKIRSFLINI